MSKLQTAGSVNGKETIYIDVDDEITAIIDKVGSAKGKVIALVLPKRATVLQSIVNMKLLKRTADNSGKNVVLITTEAGLMPLAGGVGLYVAATPNSRPEIPAAPAGGPDGDVDDLDEPLNIIDGNSGEAGDDFDPRVAGAKSVGELATASTVPEEDIDESIDMNDDAAGPTVGGPALGKVKKDRKLAVPNFDSLRKRIALGVVVLVVLVVGYIFAFVVLPKATVTISTDTSKISTNQNITLTTAAKALDTSNDTTIVPATQQAQQKTDTQQVASTGQVNNGAKAAGTVTLVNCTTDSSEVSLPAGTSLTASGHTYTLNNSVDLPLSGHQNNGNCKSINGVSSASVGVTALKGGADYNTATSVTFSSSAAGSGVTITGSASGGTDQITKIVAQADIDSATSKIKAADTTAVKQQMVAALQAKGLQAVDSTFLAGDPQVTTSAKAGDTADNVTVTAVTAYTMLGAKKSDLTTIVDANVNKQLEKGKQVILNDGVANAQFSQQNPATATSATVSMNVKSVAGPQIDAAKLATQLMGMKSGDVTKFVKQTPGVTDVHVKFSPFWVSSVPKKASKITINIDKV